MARLIVALDYPDAASALSMAERLRGTGAWVKIGLELFTCGGPAVVESVRRLGLPVMLDLKFHDIPNTVLGAVRSACAMGVDLMTVHLVGGERMVRAAVDGVREGAGRCAVGRPLLFGVTVLTSMAPGELPGHDGDLGSFVVGLAAGAAEWGLDGVVSSGHEVAAIKGRCPSLLCLTPGIRPASEGGADDQRRTMTPSQAVAAGSDFLVVGRPVTKAGSPADAVRAILAEMGSAERR